MTTLIGEEPLFERKVDHSSIGPRGSNRDDPAYRGFHGGYSLDVDGKNVSSDNRSLVSTILSHNRIAISDNLCFDVLIWARLASHPGLDGAATTDQGFELGQTLRF